MATTDTITKCLAILGIAYPRFEMKENTAEVYAMLLSDLPDNLLMAATQQHATTSKWFPSVAELLAAAGDILDEAEGVPEAGEAWAEALRIAKAAYPGDQRRNKELLAGVSHPLVLDAIRSVGGIESIGQSQAESVVQSHFVRDYRELRQRKRKQRLMLPGVREAIRAIAEKRRPGLPERAGE